MKTESEETWTLSFSREIYTPYYEKNTKERKLSIMLNVLVYAMLFVIAIVALI